MDCIVHGVAKSCTPLSDLHWETGEDREGCCAAAHGVAKRRA